MCCFIGNIDVVANTKIFARASNGAQFLVYSMTYAARSAVTMVLPLPVKLGAREDAVRFVNLEKYPDFFEDLLAGFPRPEFTRGLALAGTLSITLSAPPLVVHDVGSFEASFVPTIDDFDRLDARFRFPAEVWERLPAYRDYGFAVFKLKGTASPLDVHPMALEFPRRDLERLFFPTVHVHDGLVHEDADFDHLLYCQLSTNDTHRHGWLRSIGPAAGFVDSTRARGIVDPKGYCWQKPIRGRRVNADTWLGKDDSVPEYLGLR